MSLVSAQRRWWSAALPLFLAVSGYAVCLVFIDPLYEYPVGDDWAYAQAAKSLFAEGRLIIPDPSIASLIFQTVWSYPFLWFAGRFSFAALHLATVMLFLFGVVAWYLLLRELGFGRWLCSFGTALLVLNPFILPLSATFHTDVPSLSLVLGATYGYAAWLRSGRLAPLAAGSVLSALSVLVRQSGVVVPVAALFTALGLRAFVQRPLRSRDMALVLGPPVAALAALYVWVTFFHGVPLIWKFRTLDALNLERILQETYVDPFVTLHYLALFVLPGLVVLAGSRMSYRYLLADSRRSLGLAGALAVVLVPTVWLAVERGVTMPYFPGDDFLWREFIEVPWGLVTMITGIGGGILLMLAGGAMARFLLSVYWRLAVGPWRSFLRTAVLGAAAAVVLATALFAMRVGQAPVVGIGEAFVAHVYETRGAIGGVHTFPLEYWTSKVAAVYEHVRLAVLLAGVPAAVGLVGVAYALRARPARVPPSGQAGRPSGARVLVYLSGVLSLGFFIVTGLAFGRYLVPLLPAAIVLVLTALHRLGGSRILAVVVIVIWGVFSTLNGDAVIQFHGAVWKAHQQLLAQGLSPRDIDPGTYTVMGWYIDLDRYRLAGRVPRWWVVSDLYRIRPPFQVSESLAEGYEAVGSVPFTNYLAPGQQQVVILRKRGA